LAQQLTAADSQLTSLARCSHAARFKTTGAGHLAHVSSVITFAVFASVRTMTPDRLLTSASGHMQWQFKFILYFSKFFLKQVQVIAFVTAAQFNIRKVSVCTS